MIKFNHYSILSIIVLAICCNQKGLVEVKNLEEIKDFNILEYGAIPNDGLDDSKAFIDIFSFINMVPGEKIIRIPNGDFNIEKRLELKLYNSDIKIIGENSSKIIFHKDALFYISSNYNEFDFEGKIYRNDTSISLNTELISSGKCIRIYSDTPYETGWNYYENDIHILKKAIGNRVILDEPIIFNYDSNEEKVKIQIFEKGAVEFDNITVQIIPNIGKYVQSAIVAQGVRFTAKNFRIFKDPEAKGVARGFDLASCIDVELNQIEFDNLEYGLLTNFCRNIKASNIVAKDCRHAIVPATATINVYGTDIVGIRCQGVIDAHQAFKVHYNNVKDEQATEYSNCRALGVKITNAQFEIKSGYYKTYAYWSNQLLTEDYQYLYKEYDSHFENVKWVSDVPGHFNGITVYSCRNWTLINCISHSAANYGQIYGRVTVDNCDFGAIRLRTYNADLTNTTLNGELFRKTSYAISLSGSGNAEMRYLNVINYKPNTYFLDIFHNSNESSLLIENSNICYLAGWAQKIQYPKNIYRNMTLVNSTFTGFDRISLVVPKLLEELNVNSKN